MAKVKRYYYLLDNLTAQKGELLKQGLKAVSTVIGVGVDIRQSILEISANRNPHDHVKTACDVAGTPIRAKIKKKLLQ